LVAKHYPEKWRQFVLDTSKSPYSFAEERLVIPHHRLVQLLVEIGEIEYAASITYEMVNAVLREVSGQPLRQPAWING
jgi:hypothetical protein